MEKDSLKSFAPTWWLKWRASVIDLRLTIARPMRKLQHKDNKIVVKRIIRSAEII